MTVRRPLVREGGRTRQLAEGEKIPASAVEGGGAGTVRIVSGDGVVHRLALDMNGELPVTLSDGSESSVPTQGVVYG